MSSLFELFNRFLFSQIHIKSQCFCNFQTVSFTESFNLVSFVFLRTEPYADRTSSAYFLKKILFNLDLDNIIHVTNNRMKTVPF